MSSNAKAMTLEERLVQHIKETGLGVLITDEDAITELTRRAVREALLQPKREQDRYGNYSQQKDSPVVEAARVIAKTAIEKVTAAEVERIVADPETMAAIRTAIIAHLPLVMHMMGERLANQAAVDGANKAMAALRELPAFVKLVSS